MKHILPTITLFCLIASLGFAEESQDARFKTGDNLYVKELSAGIMKAYGCKGWELLNVEKDKLPTMFFSISEKDTGLFPMKVSFTERKDDILVILFTIVAVE